MIYLDNNATTALAPEALEAMLPFFVEHFGNPASKQHAYGWVAEEAVDQSANTISSVLNVEPAEVCFTSGATESCNLALKGIYALYQRKGKHIVTVATEHKAVLDTCHALEATGAEVTYLGVNSEGVLDLDQVREAIRPDTVLVSVMWANNETGVIHPIVEIGKICAAKGVLLFSDATQAVGKVNVSPREAGVQLLAFSAHKFHGPKGCGGLYISKAAPRVKLAPLIHGGGHQGGVRSGTLNVPGIVGMARALQIAHALQDKEAQRLGRLRDKLEQAFLALPSVAVNGTSSARLSHVLNIRFTGIDGAALMSKLSKEIALASGSACTAANPEPSHVLLAMGKSRDEAKASIRISLGRNNDEEEIDIAIKRISECVQELRESSISWKLNNK